MESRSGSTIISVATIAQTLHAREDTRALVTNKTSEAKIWRRGGAPDTEKDSQ